MSLQEQKSVTLHIKETTAWVTVNRPESLNALNTDVLISIQQILEEIRVTSGLRAVVITGAGEKAFVAGADIATMNGLGPRAIADYVELGQRTMRQIETFPLPVIAAVNGFALGGGLELALACDLIIAAESAKVGQPEVNLGIIPGFGGTQRLVTRCGVGTARRLCYTGDLLTASEALQYGVVDKIVAKETLLEEVEKICLTISQKAPLAVQAVKRVVNKAIEEPLLAGLRREVEEFLSVFTTKDRAEGMQAFMQKRTAKFNGD